MARNQRKAESRQARWQRLKLAAGLCTSCGQEPIRPGKTRCEACYERIRVAQRNRYRAAVRRLASPHACALCGRRGHNRASCTFPLDRTA